MKIKPKKTSASLVKKETSEEFPTDEIIDSIDSDHPVTKDKHLDWVYWYAMYLGHHYWVPDYNNNELIRAYINRSARSVYNLTAGFVDTFVAKMLKDRPVPMVYPLTFEPSDIKAARIGSVALEYWWRKYDLSDMWFDVVLWAAITGTSIVKQYWDKWAGETISGEEPEALGEVRCEIVPPWNFFPDPSASDISKARWAVHTYVMPLSEIKRLYPEKAKDLAGEDVSDYRDVLSSYTSEISERAAQVTGSAAESKVWVREYWERGESGIDRGFGDGKGLLKIRANGTTLYEGKNPGDDSLPFITYAVKKRPDSIWGEGLIKQVVQCQHDLNRINSQIMENIDWMANVKWAIPRGSQLKEGALNKEVSEAVEFDGEKGMAPHQMQVIPIPNHVFQYKSEVVQAMMDIVGLHEVSFAQLPERGSQMSGRALTSLVEAEAVRFSKEIMRLSTAMKSQAMSYLSLAKKHYGERRTARIVGSYRGVEIESFIKSDLDGQTDVYVEVGSGFGLSPSAKNEQIMALLDRKIIPPDEALRLTEYGGLGKLYFDANLDQSKAQRHLDIILNKGAAPPISEYDNHAAMVKVFMDFIRRPEYDDLDIGTKNMVETYISNHVAAMQAQAVQQQPGQQQGQGQQPAQPPSAGQIDQQIGQAGQPPA